MPDYFVSGGCLRSDLTFPELSHAHNHTPNWMLRLGTLSKIDESEVLSDAELSPTCRIRLTRGDGWFRYSHSCTGSFEVFAKGRRILFEPAAHGDLNGARADFVSRVLPYCAEHASISVHDWSLVGELIEGVKAWHRGRVHGAGRSREAAPTGLDQDFPQSIPTPQPVRAALFSCSPITT